MASGTVKFFNDAKGFGFIAPEDGGSDIFVHISAVERSGLNGLGEGDIVSFEVQQDRRSGKLAAVNLEFISPGAAAPRAPRGGGGSAGGYHRQDQAPRGSAPTSGSGSGVVKWFNTTKGFGFIQPNDGGADVFVHISAVERAGLNGLNEGQSVSYDIEQDRKTGKLAVANLRVSR